MDMIVDLANSVIKGLSQPPPTVALTATTNGVGVDLQAGTVRTHAIVSLGAVGGSGVFNTKMQESDDNTTFADVADANSYTGNMGTANTVSILSFMRTKRYVRSVATLVSGTNGSPSCVVLTQKKYSGAGTGINTGVDRSPSN